MKVYFDANILVALFTEDATSVRVGAMVSPLLKAGNAIIVSDWAELELASTIARLVRMKAISSNDARQALADFGYWREGCERVEVDRIDVASATELVNRLEFNLHGTDAVHVAIAKRLGAPLLTLDAKMRTSAKKAGLEVL